VLVLVSVLEWTSVDEEEEVVGSMRKKRRSMEVVGVEV
jgi:hypothetical protein